MQRLVALDFYLGCHLDTDVARRSLMHTNRSSVAAAASRRFCECSGLTAVSQETITPVAGWGS